MKTHLCFFWSKNRLHRQESPQQNVSPEKQIKHQKVGAAEEGHIELSYPKARLRQIDTFLLVTW